MRRFIFLLILIMFSCNNATKENSIEVSEMETISIDDANTSEFEIEKPNYNQLNIIEEKLQETYDLIYLSEKNSDFETTEKTSSLIIPNLILDSLSNESSPTINNVFQIGNRETINDSISHINFIYTIKQQNSEKTDTLKAIIKKQNITIEGQTKTAIKIDFTKYRD